MGDLESLKDITSFTFLSDALHDGIDEFGTFGVVTFGPVVSGSALSENEIVGTEKRSVRSGSDGIHGTGLQIGEDCTWDIAIEKVKREVQRNRS